MPDIDVDKIWGAAETSYRSMDGDRADVRRLHDHYIGHRRRNRQSTEPDEDERGTPYPLPMNLIEPFVNTLTRKIVAKNPAVHLQTSNQEFLLTANMLTSVANRAIRDCDLSTGLRGCVQEAMFAPICLALVGNNRDMGGGKFGYSAQRILFENVVLDMGAESWEARTYVGHIYSRPLTDIKQDKRFSSKRKDVEASERRMMGDKLQIGDRSVRHGPYDFEDHGLLVQLHLPEYDLLLTYDIDGNHLLTEEWQDAPGGPYEKLHFLDRRRSPLGLNPTETIFDLHESINELVRKTIWDACNEREIDVYRGGNEEDAKRERNTPHGGMIGVQDPNSVVRKKIGGASASTLAAIQNLRNMWDFSSGNISLVAGLQAQSDTATQDQILARGADVRLSDMTNRVYEFTRRIIGRDQLLWYIWNNDGYYGPIMVDVPGVRDPVEDFWSADHRRGDLGAYIERVVPYSMADHTPQQLLRSLMEYVGQLQGLQPILQAQGATIDMKVLDDAVTQVTGIDRFGKIVKFIDRPLERETALDLAKTSGRKKPPTNSTYTRISRSASGNGRNGDVAAMIKAAGSESRNGSQ